MKVLRWVGLWMAGVALAGEPPTPPEQGSLAEVSEAVVGVVPIDAEGLRGLLGEETVIIDLRSAARRAGGFIDGSLSLPAERVGVEPLRRLIPHRDTPVIFYGDGFADEAVAVREAVAAGYRAVYWFRGGWREWLGKGLMVSLGADI